jgi:cytoskeletal protein CcmA (bactofilin family)
MSARPTDKVQVACPHCGHRQAESRAAISTNCKQCRQYFRVHEKESGSPGQQAPAQPRTEQRRITCFDCGTELEVPVSAESTMCKRCSSYVDLKDYRIEGSVSKNFKTKGTFVIEPRGYVFNTEATVEHAVIRGRFLGKLDARGSLTLYSGAQIRGTFRTARLIIPAGNQFRWPETILARDMDIAGELAANIRVTGTAHLRATARLFGNVEALHLRVEAGAVVVGHLSLGTRGQGPPQKAAVAR